MPIECENNENTRTLTHLSNVHFYRFDNIYIEYKRLHMKISIFIGAYVLVLFQRGVKRIEGLFEVQVAYQKFFW